MQVQHLAVLYVSTCGQDGILLGSDEKEIIFLIYAIIDVVINQIVGIQQYFVQPIGPFAADITDRTSAIADNMQILPKNELVAVSKAAGKPLNEVISQFDAYVRSLSIDPESGNFHIIADGQLPIRQCIHPEASAKNIQLPSYYYRFCDLRKEYMRFKSADLSRALIPVKDIKKLPGMPVLPSLPLSIEDMILGLELTPYEGSEFYVKESRDMVNVVQTLIAAGHKFEVNESVNFSFEPGICSIDDDIDGSCIVRARGLPWQSSDQDIAKFFKGLNVAKGGVALCLSPLGRRNGEALVRFVSQEHRDMALKRHKHHIANRYIEVYRATGEDFLAVAGGASNEAQTFLSKGAHVIIRMRGLPYECTAKQVIEFFAAGENSCEVLDGADGVMFVKKPDGRATGDAFVLFANEADAPKALLRHRECIGQRYIELFRSTTAEVQQVLNRSMDSKQYESSHPPLIAQLPPVQVPLLPQHIITSGTTKNCIRLRGLPYEARVEHILHFLEDFANNILYQGVHMVYNAQGQPSGEAFIQMDSEEAARASAQQKHNQFMIFGKKYRYIEVFQCSGDDMNLVLNGGLQAPVNANKPPLLSPGMLSQTHQSTHITQIPHNLTVPHHHSHLGTPNMHPHYISGSHVTSGAIPGHSQISHHQHPSPSMQLQSVPSPATPGSLALCLPGHSQAYLAQQQAQFIAQQSLLARQSAATASAPHNEQIFCPNFTILSNASANHSALGIQSATTPVSAPQFVFMPRQYVHPFANFGFLSPQFHTLPVTHQPIGHHLSAAVLNPSAKRTYDSAFQPDNSATIAPKRQLTRSGNSFAPFYPPSL